MKTILSLFDFSGNWSSVYAKNNYQVIRQDIKLGQDIFTDSLPLAIDDYVEGNKVNGLISASPCTDFAVSGARWWKEKDNRPADYYSRHVSFENTIDLSIGFVLSTLFMVELLKPDFWSLENPVGRLPTLIPELGKALLFFNPCDFAGYLNISSSDHNELDRIRRKDGDNVTRDEIDFVLKCEAYTKKTGLWGEFNCNLVKNSIEPVKVCRQGSPIQVYGGKSAKTKEARSNTPIGFSLAFFNSNH